MQVTLDGFFRYAAAAWFHQALATLANSGVRGVAVDVWVRAAHSDATCPWGCWGPAQADSAG